MIGADWENSFCILGRDHDKTLSYNAGYPMGSNGWGLKNKARKIGQYSLGNEYEPASIEKCKMAISIMN